MEAGVHEGTNASLYSCFVGGQRAAAVIELQDFQDEKANAKERQRAAGGDHKKKALLVPGAISGRGQSSAIIGEKIKVGEKAFAAEAKERQLAGQKTGGKTAGNGRSKESSSSVQNLAPSKSDKTRDRAAKAVGTSAHITTTKEPLMPYAAKRFCPRAYSRPAARKENRPSACARGYGHRWRVARAIYLARNPLCCECEKQDRYVAATVVDHIVPHRGDDALFWDESNWQPLCKRHHDQKTGRGE